MKRIRYKIVVKTRDNIIFVKAKSKNKDFLLKKAEQISLKHPSWRVYVVNEETIIE